MGKALSRLSGRERRPISADRWNTIALKQLTDSPDGPLGKAPERNPDATSGDGEWDGRTDNRLSAQK